MKTVRIEIFHYENDLLHVTRILFWNWTACYQVCENATINVNKISSYVRNKVYNFHVFKFEKNTKCRKNTQNIQK